MEPIFMDQINLSHEQLTDPDYALKQLQEAYGSIYPITCSKCHHCR